MPSTWCTHCGGYVNHDWQDMHHRVLDVRGPDLTPDWLQRAAAFASTIGSLKRWRAPRIRVRVTRLVGPRF